MQEKRSRNSRGELSLFPTESKMLVIAETILQKSQFPKGIIAFPNYIVGLTTMIAFRLFYVAIPEGNYRFS